MGQIQTEDDEDQTDKIREPPTKVNIEPTTDYTWHKILAYHIFLAYPMFFIFWGHVIKNWQSVFVIVFAVDFGH